MKKYLLLILLPVLAGAEELPESSRIAGEDEAGMSERFSAPVMDNDEMKSLYLESPVELGNVEDRSGMQALSDENRYLESDLLFHERQQSDRLDQTPITLPEEKEPEVPRIPLLAPLREL
jgi:hypothetical protein